MYCFQPGHPQAEMFWEDFGNVYEQLLKHRQAAQFIGVRTISPPLNDVFAGMRHSQFETHTPASGRRWRIGNGWFKTYLMRALPEHGYVTVEDGRNLHVKRP